MLKDPQRINDANPLLPFPILEMELYDIARSLTQLRHSSCVGTSPDAQWLDTLLAKSIVLKSAPIASYFRYVMYTVLLGSETYFHGS